MLFGRRLGVAGVIHSWKRPSHGLSGANPLLRRRATFVVDEVPSLEHTLRATVRRDT